MLCHFFWVIANVLKTLDIPESHHTVYTCFPTIMPYIQLY